jgi:hypothetical protein
MTMAPRKIFPARKSRGQSLTEFMVLLSMMVTYVIVFTFIYSGQYGNQFNFIDSLRGKAVSESVGLGASAAYIAGNGSETPVRIASINGNVTINGNVALVTLSDRAVYSPLATSMVSGNFSTGLKTARNAYGNITVN